MHLSFKITLLFSLFALASCQKPTTLKNELLGTFWTHARESMSVSSSIAVLHFRDDTTLILGVGNPEDNTAWGFPLSYASTGSHSFSFGFSINSNNEQELALHNQLNTISGTGLIEGDTLTLTFSENDTEVYKLNKETFSFVLFGEEQ